jgi:glycosyltransferase involved in cell wall biosynthesis
MKVVVLLGDMFDATGGIQTFNRCLVKALDELAGKNGWEVTVLAMNDSGRSELMRRYMNPGRTHYRGFSGRRGRFVLSALRQATKADITVFGHVHLAPLVHALRLTRPAGQNFLVVYGLDVAKPLPFLRRLGASVMNTIISISEFTAGEMQRWNRISRDRFVLLPCTLDPYYASEPVPASRHNLGLQEGKMILTVSRLDARDGFKGVDTMIRAMPSVLAQIPDAFYVVVGDGTDRMRLQSLAETLGAADHVHFAGYVPDRLLPSYYQQCDVFVLASSGEGFGIVFLEAMRFAKPCVGGRAGAIPEVVEEGLTGFLVEPGDTRGLADAMVTVLQDSALQAKMGQAGRRRLEQEFSFDAFRARLESALCG